MFLEAFKRTKFLKFGSHLKKLIAQPLQLTPLLASQVQNTFKRLHFGLYFLSVSDLVKGGTELKFPWPLVAPLQGIMKGAHWLRKFRYY